mmetsp:Transcript_26737/g.83753  ORF Transcript_26737/g.83753 Transcript_26737/m.83753 type:complete len:366 (-) Transcript_26737:1882-2979(-)
MASMLRRCGGMLLMLLVLLAAGAGALRAPVAARGRAPAWGAATGAGLPRQHHAAPQRPAPLLARTEDARDGVDVVDAAKVGLYDAQKQLQRFATKAYASHDSRVVVNLVLVAAAVSAAAFALFTVDSDLWRGWTWDEVILRLLPDNWAAYEDAVENTPLASKAALNFGTYAIGDWIAQMAAQAKQKNAGEEEGAGGFDALDFDLPRAVTNGLIGASLGPMCHYYYEFSAWLIPATPAWHKIFNVMMDQTIWTSVWNGIYFLMLNLSKGLSLEEAWEDVKAKWWPVLTTGWRLWPAAHIITYGVIPLRHKLLWVDAVDLVWCAILASYGAAEEEGAAVEALVDADAEEVAVAVAETGEDVVEDVAL